MTAVRRVQLDSIGYTINVGFVDLTIQGLYELAQVSADIQQSHDRFRLKV